MCDDSQQGEDVFSYCTMQTCFSIVDLWIEVLGYAQCVWLVLVCGQVAAAEQATSRGLSGEIQRQFLMLCIGS